MLAGTLLVSLTPVALWFAVIGTTIHKNLIVEIWKFTQENSTLVPLAAFPAAITTNPVEAPFLVGLTGYRRLFVRYCC